VRFLHTTIRVAWGDTDAARVVWFGNFLRYVEAGEVALFDAHGRPMSELFREHQILLPRTNLTISYKSPARFDDLLDVGLAVHGVTERRVQHVFEIRQQRSGQLVAEGSYEIACVDAGTFKARPFPDEVRVVFEAAMRQ